ncbi:hypothetical protein GCM10010342_49440 [Streptomyces anulatus]|nr:hypothetical protein GCM10010342_49440 [Streptomyces anulatus]
MPAPAQPHLDAVAYGRIIFDEDDAWHAGISRSWDGKVVEGGRLVSERQERAPDR